MKYLITVLTLTFALNTMAQNMPYQEIPEYRGAYTTGKLIARMIDGLGYRFHWATDGLRSEDLAYSPGNEGKTSRETINHIYDLSCTILKVAEKEILKREKKDTLTFEEQRIATLKNLEKAGKIFSEIEGNGIVEYRVVFEKNNDLQTFPLWNLINGQISDAIYHTGQIVSYRRSSSNPMNPKVSVFTGKNRD